MSPDRESIHPNEQAVKKQQAAQPLTLTQLQKPALEQQFFAPQAQTSSTRQADRL
jgi:hypothetical protein